MTNFYFLLGNAVPSLSLVRLLLGLWLSLLVPAIAQAQVPAWAAVATASNNQTSGSSYTRAVATDASGNVFVTGSFTGQVYFGSTLLSSSQSPSNDLFVAKYMPSSGTWAWAQSGGGTGNDYGYGIAVSGSNVYVTGTINNTSANLSGVLFGGTGPTTSTVQVNGAGSQNSDNLLLAKYTDNGSSATLNWTQTGGAVNGQYGYGVFGQGVAVSGNSVYVTGYMSNTSGNSNGVVFGGTGTTAGTVPVNGASTTNNIDDFDLLLVKYTDNGSSATLGWTQVGGGTSDDRGYAVAVSGSNVYVTGYVNNTSSNGNKVLFGGGGTTAGTVPINGTCATTTRVFLLAKYFDNGSSTSLGWAQTGGGTSSSPNSSISGDYGRSVAVNGSEVYVTGTIYNTANNVNGVVFGGAGTTAGTVPVSGASTMVSQDLLLAKYTDNGISANLDWTQVGGGTDSDYGQSVAVSGSNVYVTGTVVNTKTNSNAVLFGGTGTTAGTVPVNGASSEDGPDLVLARYTDNGGSASLNWTQVGGGGGYDSSYGVAVSGNNVYVGGSVGNAPSFAFGVASTAPLLGTYNDRAVLTQADTGSGSWQAVASVFNGGGSAPTAIATDTSGNVFVTGYFWGQVYFGSTLLSSPGGTVFGNPAIFNLFVAKYVPSSNTWAWAQSGGGSGDDGGQGIAVSGNSVYVTGYIHNDTANTNAVVFGGTGTTAGTVPQYGASTTASEDLILAKYTDNGSSATLGWTQVGGGSGGESGKGVAVNGTSVYITGEIDNNLSNARKVVFGGTGTTAGTVPQYGANTTLNLDILLAKYTDNGPTATLNWTQVGGGSNQDEGLAVAVSGRSVYVTGYTTNTLSNNFGVLFGGTGTTAGTVPQFGASTTASEDLVLAKYTDNGPTATLNWAQSGGGTGDDTGYGIAVSGSSVYVTGYIHNDRANTNAVLFGGTGTTMGIMSQSGASATASKDIILAKYTDNGSSASLGWTQVGGGTDADVGYGVAVSGNSVYVTGTIKTSAANDNRVTFGGTGTTAGTVPVRAVSYMISDDLLLAKYTDNGSSASLGWTQVGGSASGDKGWGVAVSGQRLVVAGSVGPNASFGSITITNPTASGTILASLIDSGLGPLPVRPAALNGSAGLCLYPNPAQGSATVSGLPVGTRVQMYDTLSRLLLQTTIDSTGTARLVLPAGLAAGIYVVRGGGQAVRLSVE